MDTLIVVALFIAVVAHLMGRLAQTEAQRQRQLRDGRTVYVRIGADVSQFQEAMRRASQSMPGGLA